MRSVGAVAAESYCNAASTTATRTQKAAVTTWTVARDAAKLDGAMPEAAAVTTMVSGSRGSVVTMTKAGVEVDLNQSRPKQSPDQIRPGGPELGLEQRAKSNWAQRWARSEALVRWCSGLGAAGPA
jgi:hypothetical protein